MRRFWLLFMVLVFSCAPVFAQDEDEVLANLIWEAPSSLKVGSPFVSSVKPDEALDFVAVSFLGKEIPIRPDDSGVYSVLLGIDVNNKKVSGKSVPLKLIVEVEKLRYEFERSIDLVREEELPVESLTVSSSMVSPPKSEQARIAREAKLGSEALATVSVGGLPRLPLVRPVPGILTSRYWGSRVFNGESKPPHRALDFRAAVGTPVKAAADGVVILSGNFYFAGGCVYVDHGAGLITFYCHLSEVRAKKGDRLKAGDVLGLSGATGRVTGPHLHLAVIAGGQRVDPEPLLSEDTLPQGVVRSYRLVR